MALFQYWNRLRGSRPAPLRTEIEPADIKQLLPDTFILERDRSAEPVFRLAGTRICATYGKELRGNAFLSLWASEDQGVAGRLARHALDGAAAAVITFEGTSRDGRQNHFELLILPVDGGREGSRALGTIQPCTRPFWLGSDPVVENHIKGFRLIYSDRKPQVPAERPIAPAPLAAGGGGSVAAYAGIHGRRIRHLVVFEGGRGD